MHKKHEKSFLIVTRSLANALDQLAHIEKGIKTGNVDVDSPEVYNAITKGQEYLNETIKAIHDIEDRKQEEALKNVNLDKLFEGHPVNAYVQAVLGFLPSDDFKPEISMVDLISNFNKACLELAKHQQETEEALKEATAPKPKTEEEFVHYVTDALNLAYPGLADTYKDALRLGIKQLKRHGHGVAPFVIPLESGAAYGKLRINKGVIEIKLNDLNFVFDPNAVEEEVAAEPAPIAEGQVIACECTENCTTYCIKNISKEEYMREVMEAHLTPCTCDDRSDCSTPCERDVLLDLAIAQLTDKKEFKGSDYDLIRYFLRVVEGADDEEVNSLSNRALELAWNRHWYLRNEK